MEKKYLPAELPLVIYPKKHAVHTTNPFDRKVFKVNRKISVTSYPIIGRTGKFQGAVAIFLGI